MHFCRAMLCKRGRHAVYVCLSACLSVAFLDSVKTNKHIFNFIHRRIATPFYFFHTKCCDNIPTGPPPLSAASNAGGVRKNRDSGRISGYRSITAWASAINIIDGPYNSCGAHMFTAQTTTHQWIRRRGTIEANYWQTRSIARPLCDIRGIRGKVIKTNCCTVPVLCTVVVQNNAHV